MRTHCNFSPGAAVSAKRVGCSKMIDLALDSGIAPDTPAALDAAMGAGFTATAI